MDACKIKDRIPDASIRNLSFFTSSERSEAFLQAIDPLMGWLLASLLGQWATAEALPVCPDAFHPQGGYL